jgi:hypothetical protein
MSARLRAVLAVVVILVALALLVSRAASPSEGKRARAASDRCPVEIVDSAGSQSEGRWAPSG